MIPINPQGDIIDLPAGSTPIDFAYHVHTEIGHAVAVQRSTESLFLLIMFLRLATRLKSLPQNACGPSRDWLNPNLGLVHTGRARSKIKQWFKRQDQVVQSRTGQEYS